MNCRVCKSSEVEVILNLNASPPSNNFLDANDTQTTEKFYPLQLVYCFSCGIGQTSYVVDPRIIFNNDYQYCSSVSKTYREHCSNFIKRIFAKGILSNNTKVIELACNDGYLINEIFKISKFSIGIDPSGTHYNCYSSARIVRKMFCLKLAKRLAKIGIEADLIIANNVIAHVPNIVEFFLSARSLLTSKGIMIVEFPDFDELLAHGLFDTIYHEHYYYYSPLGISNLCKKVGLILFDSERINVHGGSLRVYLKKSSQEVIKKKEIIGQKITRTHLGQTFRSFRTYAHRIKIEALQFLTEAKEKNLKVIGYGAAAKASTFLNFCGINRDLIDCVVDKSVIKINRFIPGVRIPIKSSDKISQINPDIIVIFVWNIKNEVIEQVQNMGIKNVKFVTFLPKLQIL